MQEFFRRARREAPRILRGALPGDIEGSLLRRDLGVHVSVKNGQFRVGKLVHLQSGVRIAVGAASGSAPSCLDIGERTVVGSRTTINCTSDLKIGAYCMIGWECTLLDTDFHQLQEIDGSVAPISAPTTIEDHVWLGARVMVLKGVTIGAGSAIGAGSVVVHDIPPRTLAAGLPARVIRPIAGWN